MSIELRRKLIVTLLAVSCVAAGTLLWKSEPVQPKVLKSPVQIDSLITLALDDLQVLPSQVRERTIPVDSLFQRKVYHLRVAPNFSKTTLHYTIQQELWPYGVKTLARIEFPERDMHIHLLYNNKIHRSLILRDDPDLMLQRHQPEILPGQDYHEVD